MDVITQGKSLKAKWLVLLAVVLLLLFLLDIALGSVRIPTC